MLNLSAIMIADKAKAFLFVYQDHYPCKIFAKLSPMMSNILWYSWIIQSSYGINFFVRKFVKKPISPMSYLLD